MKIINLTTNNQYAKEFDIKKTGRLFFYYYPEHIKGEWQINFLTCNIDNEGNISNVRLEGSNMFYKGNEAKPKRALVDLNGLAYIYNYNNSWKAVVQVLSKSNNDDDYLICDFLEFK